MWENLGKLIENKTVIVFPVAFAPSLSLCSCFYDKIKHKKVLQLNFSDFVTCKRNVYNDKKERILVIVESKSVIHLVEKD